MNDTFHKYEQSIKHFKGFSNVSHNVKRKNKHHKHNKINERFISINVNNTGEHKIHHRY